MEITTSVATISSFMFLGIVMGQLVSLYNIFFFNLVQMIYRECNVNELTGKEER